MDVGFQWADKASLITQVKCFEEFPKQEVPWNVSQKTEAQLTQQCIAQWHEFVRGRDYPHMLWGKDSSPWEDTKAFLVSFEQVAQACQWPREEWVARLLPALSGEAQKAFSSLEARDKEDYGKVKAAIMLREANCTETLRQHFRQFRSREVEDPRRIYSQLQELCHRWLRPEKHSKEQILELLILEQFLAILPPELQSWIRASGPENCTQAAALAEDFLLSHQETETCQAPPDVKEETMSLGEAEGTVPETMYWEVMEGRLENADSLGGLLVPKAELEEEETQYTQACEDGATFPGSISGWQELGPETGAHSVTQHSGLGLLNYRPSGLQLSIQQLTPTIPWWSPIQILTRADSASLRRSDEIGLPWAIQVSTLKTSRFPQNISSEAVTHEGSSACHKSCDGIPSKNENENPLQGSPERRELPEALLGYSQSNGWLRPEAYEGRPSVAQSQRSRQGKGQEELTGTDARAANGITASLKEKQHQCPECSHKTPFSSDLIRHMRIHAGDSCYPCITCGKTFKHISGLNGHQRTHTSKLNRRGRRQSPHCASSQRTLQDNKKPSKRGKKNPQKESDEPEEVNGMLAEVAQSTIPEATMIPEQERELEGQPEKELTGNQNDSIKLLEHNSSSEGDTRTVWVKKLLYLQGGNMRPHRSGPVSQESPHIVEKPHNPPLNGQPILRSLCLKGHQQIHRGEKLCECPECWETLRRGWVKEHQKVHKGEKPFICFKCGKCFRWTTQLRRHLEVHT